MAASPNANWRQPEWQAKRKAVQSAAGKKGGAARAGISRGWTRKTINAYRKDVRKYSKKLLKKMLDKMPPEETAFINDNSMAKEALVTAVSVMRDGTITVRDKLAAAKLILDFTKQRPATRADVIVRKAEDILDELAAKEGALGPAIEHQEASEG